MSPSEEYQRRLHAREKQSERLDRLSDRVGTVRLLLGIGTVVALGFVIFRSAFSLAWLLAPVLIFIALVLYHDRVRRSLVRAQRAAAFYRAGLARIEDRWMGAGQRGERFIDPHHVYSGDLDLFGANSLFELLCIARTRMGEDTLARWLLAPTSISEVKERQAAVSELRELVDLREQLAILGEQSTAGVHPDALLSWASAQTRLQQKWIKWVACGLATAAIVTAGVWFLTGVGSPFLLVLLIEIGIAYLLRKPIREAILSAEHAFQDLKLLASFLARLEQQPFHMPLLRSLKERFHSHTRPASLAIAKLQSIVQLIESRRNMFMALLDVPLMISVQATFAAEAWRRAHCRAVKTWLDVVGEFEALLSIGTYSYEHPADPFPELIEHHALFRAQAIAHPLLPQARAVANDIELNEQARIVLISGSNMSGKSTLLRTVGINVVLAMAGAPVRARSLQLSALQVGASIRINDSLQEGSSRFYAEITRLRQVFELAGKTPPLLALLDEVLQGTNSADRRIGAQGIVRALLERGAIALVTTHDLALTEMGSDIGSSLVNVHFQDEIDNGKMKFDYKLRPGIVTKSNALALMRTIGLDV